jgi:hypothetical protein
MCCLKRGGLTEKRAGRMAPDGLRGGPCGLKLFSVLGFWLLLGQAKSNSLRGK